MCGMTQRKTFLHAAAPSSRVCHDSLIYDTTPGSDTAPTNKPEICHRVSHYMTLQHATPETERDDYCISSAYLVLRDTEKEREGERVPN